MYSTIAAPAPINRWIPHAPSFLSTMPELAAEEHKCHHMAPCAGIAKSQMLRVGFNVFRDIDENARAH